MSVTGCISNISRASVHDGPGIRTVVYFKGCSLRCRWCHNPETQQTLQDIMYAPVKCIGCGRCVAVCPDHHKAGEQKMVFLREGCLRCGKCAEVCPSEALSVSGSPADGEEVIKEVLKDKLYYRESGGGVTLSGGECLLQPDFAAYILSRCKEEDISTCVETALCVAPEAIDRVLPYTDLFLTDLKIPDPKKHAVYTGRDNSLIIANLRSLAPRARVLARIPLIPGVNDSEEDKEGFGEILSGLRDSLTGVEVLRYNSMAESKYILAGREYSGFGEAQTDEAMLEFCDSLQSRLPEGPRVYTVI
ncbi:MAG: glycyl-radical enzyme activating protein [Abditibacteriota bacterium]|nr:glycyl-radical enzyme activating protein [Abditibacteriota bacterium]